MAGSFSQELEDLLNPLPKFADPEDDGTRRPTRKLRKDSARMKTKMEAASVPCGRATQPCCQTPTDGTWGRQCPVNSF
ncbi:Protein AATF [Dissostichus eleginoides]|uniref:Protein AATF n=1 Tax=Dissostichus eleginoides TaxID=100907 RepID=A0AAD9FCQ8_DISEL|nr:Protein AATF [Dissostichus eleginoides]